MTRVESLPDNILSTVLSNINQFKDLCAVSQTCRRLFENVISAANDEKLFKPAALRLNNLSTVQEIDTNPERRVCKSRGPWFNCCLRYKLASKSLNSKEPTILKLIDVKEPYVNTIPENFGSVENQLHSDHDGEMLSSINGQGSIRPAKYQYVATTKKLDTLVYRRDEGLTFDEFDNNQSCGVVNFRDKRFGVRELENEEIGDKSFFNSSPFASAQGYLLYMNCRNNTLYSSKLVDNTPTTWTTLFRIIDAQGINWSMSRTSFEGRFATVLGMGENYWPYVVYLDLFNGKVTMYSTKGWLYVEKVQLSLKPIVEKSRISNLNSEIIDYCRFEQRRTEQKNLLLRGAWVIDNNSRVVFLSYYYLEALACYCEYYGKDAIDLNMSSGKSLYSF